MEESYAIEKKEEGIHSRKKSDNKNKKWVKVLAILIGIGIWSGLVYFGYTYSKDYIDGSIEKVQKSNLEHVKKLSNQIEDLGGEIQHLKDRLENADDTLSDSTEVQEKIDDKLKNLDEQLKTLQKSLKTLQEAPHE